MVMENGNRTKDEQIIVTGTLKEGSQGELITFNIKLALLQLTCIVNIPEEGKLTAPVYVKFKVLSPFSKRTGAQQARAGEHEEVSLEAAAE